MKLRSKRLFMRMLTLAVLVVAAGQADISRARADDKPGICRPDAAAALIGKRKISDARAKKLTGATVVRQIKPGQGVTMDFLPERVTIETHPKTHRIIRAACG